MPMPPPANLDALYLHLYGLSRQDAAYIMDTFPIVRREDDKEFGVYRTKEMVLAYMNALSAGDTGVRVGGVGGAADSIWSTRDRAASMRCLGGYPRRG